MIKSNSIVILMADDDDDDVLLTSKALQKGKRLNTLFSVSNGEELLDYLLRQGSYRGADDTVAPLPDLILLDLNMPKKDGYEALREIKTHPKLQAIPIVIFTTSQADEDIYRAYKLGVNSFVTKPVTFEKLIDVMQTLGAYWFEVVALPSKLNKDTYGQTANDDSSH